MFPDTPIFNLLVQEKGNVPDEVRGAAQRIERDLQLVIPSIRPPVNAGAAQHGHAFQLGI